MFSADHRLGRQSRRTAQAAVALSGPATPGVAEGSAVGLAHRADIFAGRVVGLRDPYAGTREIRGQLGSPGLAQDRGAPGWQLPRANAVFRSPPRGEEVRRVQQDDRVRGARSEESHRAIVAAAEEFRTTS